MFFVPVSKSCMSGKQGSGKQGSKGDEKAALYGSSKEMKK